MLSDLVVLVLAATVLTLVRPLVESGGSFSGEAFHHLGNEGLVARLWPIAVALIVDRATLTFGMTE